MKEKRFAFDKDHVEKISKIFNHNFFVSANKEKNIEIRQEKYKKIYGDELFPLFVRSDSAWYMGEILLNLKKSHQSHIWLIKSLDLLDLNDGLERQKKCFGNGGQNDLFAGLCIGRKTGKMVLCEALRTKV